MVAYLRLTDANDNIYNFPPSFWITDDGSSQTQNIRNKAYAAGGRNIADGYLQARTILVEGALRADTLATLETAKRNLVKACFAGGKLSVVDDVVKRYIIVSNAMFDSSYQGDYRLEIPFPISFLAENPFWQDATEIEDINIVAGNDEFTIDNSGSDFLIYPVIEILADQGVALPGIKLTNASDGGMSCEYNDPNFVQNDLLEIDCRNGTVKRNSNSTIEFFNPARFLRLQNLVNTIRYEGNACTITFKYRKVYL